MNIYLAMDIYAGRVVRLRQGDFSKVTVYDDRPLELVRKLVDAGAKHLHVVDLEGAKSGTSTISSLIRTIKQQFTVELQVGGGVRSEETFRSFVGMGVERVVVGSTAFTNSELTHSLIAHFPDQFVLGLDLHSIDGDWTPMVHGWRDQARVTDLQSFIEDLCRSGLQQLVSTDISKDGLLGGPSLELYRYLRATFPGLKIGASGGVTTASDLSELKKTGVASCIVGKALYENRISVAEALQWQ